MFSPLVQAAPLTLLAKEAALLSACLSRKSACHAPLPSLNRVTQTEPVLALHEAKKSE